jgi:hypothetical protein
VAKRVILEGYTFTPSTKTIVVMGKWIRREQLLLITNVTRNVVLYNFSDSTFAATTVTPIVNGMNNEMTTIVVSYDTTLHVSTDKISILVEETYETINPSETLMDPVGKMRTSSPQSLIDTDFEYGPQQTKWESISVVNNRPTAFYIPESAGQQFISNAGTITQSTTAVTGTNTAFHPGMINSRLVYSDGTEAGVITAVSSATALTVTNSLTYGTAQQYVIYGFPFKNAGTPLTTAGGSTADPSILTHDLSANTRICTLLINTGGTTLYVGQPIYILNSSDQANVDGWWIIDGITAGSGGATATRDQITFKTINVPTFFYNNTSPNLYDPTKTQIFPGSWYTGSSISIDQIAAANTVATVTTSFAHGLNVGQHIHVNNVSGTYYAGTFVVASTPTATTFTYIANGGATTGNLTWNGGTNITGGTLGILYPRGQGYVIHRAFDGGVQFANQSPFNGLQQIRQTRRYFRYQSGKSIQFSTGSILKPSFSVEQIVSNGTTALVTTKNPHGIVIPGGMTTAPTVRVTGAVDINGLNTGGVASQSGTTITGVGTQFSSAMTGQTFIFADGTSAGVVTYVSATSLTAIVSQTVSSQKFIIQSTAYNGIFSVASVLSPYHFTYSTGSNTPTNATSVSGTNALAGTASGITIGIVSGTGPTATLAAPYSATLTVAGTTWATGIVPGSVLSGLSNVGAGVVTVLQVLSTTVLIISCTTSMTAGSAGTTATYATPNFAYTIPGSALTVSPSGWYGGKNRVGMFDQQNGFFFEYDGQNLYAVRRSSTRQISGTVSVTTNSPTVTGQGTYFADQLAPGDNIVIRGQSYTVNSITSQTSMTIYPEYRGSTPISTLFTYSVQSGIIVSKIVDTRIPQSQWNIDKCDGTGSSGFNVDLAKMQMFYMDYSWYGAGAIRFGFKNNRGEVIYGHRIINNNVNTEAYMRSGNMAARYETNTLAPTTYVTAWGITTATGTFYVNDASQFPPSGRIVVTSSSGTIEYMDYTSRTDTSFTVSARGVAGGSSATSFTYSATAPIKVELFAPSLATTLSHWGSAVIMDGRYDDDKSLVFAAGMNVPLTGFSARQQYPLISIRIAPSVDSGNTGAMGAKEIINRMQLILRQMDAQTSGNAFAVDLWLNAAISTGQYYGAALTAGSTTIATVGTLVGTTPITGAYVFGNGIQPGTFVSNWGTSKISLPALYSGTGITLYYSNAVFTSAGGSSLAQRYIHSSTDRLVPGTGEKIFTFFTNNSGVTQQDLSVVRDLATSILGGGANNAVPSGASGKYPDGPDVITMVATPIGTISSPSIITRLSWTEAQA